MARHARIGRIEMGGDGGRNPQVGFVIDRRGVGRCDFSQFLVLRMAEMDDRRSTRRADRPALVARLAHRGRRQKVIGWRPACGDARVTIRALLLELQVQLVRERRLLRVHGRRSEHAQPATPNHQPLYDTLQIFLPPSSDTSRLPSFIWNTATGRPQTSWESGASMKPVRKSSGPPVGLPFLKGTYATS